MNEREIKRIANSRAAEMIYAALNEGWEPADLIDEIGKENVDLVEAEIFDIAKALRNRIGQGKLDQLKAVIEEEGGVWTGNRAWITHQKLGFYCPRERAVRNLKTIASYFPDLLTPVEGEKSTWVVRR